MTTPWLEAALRRERHSRQEQEIAARVGDALEANDQVQRLLMQFYLSDRRVDFEALQTYRRVWHQRGALPESLILSLAHVLLKESIINDWALKVYLRGYSLGDPHCLEGIAAGERLLSTNTDNRHDISAAREILSVLNEDQRRKLIRPFESQMPAQDKPKKSKPAPKVIARAEFDTPAPADEDKFELGQWPEEDEEAEVPAPVKPRKERSLALAKTVWGHSRAMAAAIWRYCLVLTRVGGRSLAWVNNALLKPLLKNGINTWRQSVTLRRGSAYAAAGILFLALAIAGWRSIGGVPQPIEPTIAPVVEATPVPVTDPFTIQVAAYLKPEDAQRLVDRLKQEKIDAFWTKATSANRTWYQVKVSHFPTRDDARKYGQQLRSKGLIDDFYVSNYSR
jgi:cell division protein FtsN